MPKKSDTNQAQIVKTLRSLGVFVFSLHEVGRGCPDLLCSYRGKWLMAEIKNGKLGKLTDSQKKFHAGCKAPIAILTCPDDAIAWVRGLTQKENNWNRGRYPGKITMHWLRAAFDRVAAGEPEKEVMDDYGYHKRSITKEQRDALEELRRGTNGK